MFGLPLGYPAPWAITPAILTLGTIQCHGSGDTRSAGESADVSAVLVNCKAQVRVLPDCIHACRLIAGEIAGVIGAGEDESVLLGNVFVEFDRTLPMAAGIEEIDHRPAFRRSVDRGQIQRVALGRIGGTDYIYDLGPGTRGAPGFSLWEETFKVAAATISHAPAAMETVFDLQGRGKYFPIIDDNSFVPRSEIRRS